MMPIQTVQNVQGGPMYFQNVMARGPEMHMIQNSSGRGGGGLIGQNVVYQTIPVPLNSSQQHVHQQIQSHSAYKMVTQQPIYAQGQVEMQQRYDPSQEAYIAQQIQQLQELQRLRQLQHQVQNQTVDLQPQQHFQQQGL